MTIFSQAAFIASAGRREEFPAEGPPEIAFLGRSNVGKSSAINALVGRRRLAFASKTPGRTQTVNFYDLGGKARLVDLPGYGYARVPQSERSKWEGLVSSYLLGRESLAGVVVVMDARHPVTPQDARLLEWLAPLAVQRLALLTKSDKLSRAEQAKALAHTRGVIADVCLFSSTRREGLEALRGRLQQWLREAGSRSPK